MKKTLISKLLAVVSPLVSTTALAHTGHLADESVHGLLHIEHIIGLIVFAFVAYMVVSRNSK